MGGNVMPGGIRVGARHMPGLGSHARVRADGPAMEMTQQYLAGELSVLLAHVQAVTTTEAAGREAWSLRHAAETEPVQP